MKFSTAIVAAAAASPALAAYTNGTSTATDIHTTVVTITSCSEDKCHTEVATTGLTTVTENETVYTTYCPLSDEGVKTETNTVGTTVVTITSCDDNKCHTDVATTGLTTVTENDTIYTTYCPLTESPATEAPTTEAPATTAPATEAPVPTTEAPAPTTEAPAPTTEAAESTPATVAESSTPSTVAAVSTAENAGNANAVPAAVAGLLAVISFFY